MKYHFIAGFWWLGQALLKMKKTYFFIKNSCKYLIFKSVQLNKGKRYKIVWKKFRCFSSDKPLSLTLNEMKTKDCLKLVRICWKSYLPTWSILLQVNKWKTQKPMETWLNIVAALMTLVTNTGLGRFFDISTLINYWQEAASLDSTTPPS